MPKLNEMTDVLLRRRQLQIWDDFEYYTSGQKWTSTLAGSATIAAGNTAAGVAVMSAIDSTDNRQLYLASTNGVFLFAAGKPLFCEAYLQYTEANTSAANVAFGFCSSVGADTIVDNGAGMKTSFSGAVIFKVDGGTVWKTTSSLSTTQTTTTSSTTAGGPAYQRLRVECVPVSSTVLEVTYWVNGQQLLDGTFLKPIKDRVTYTGAAQMQLFVGLKNGSTTPETVNVDYLGGWQLR